MQQIEQIEERMAVPALEMQPGQVLPFSIASHPALQPLAEAAPSVAEALQPAAKAGFSDLAMELYGDEIEAQDRAAEAARDARLKDMEIFGAPSEDTGDAGKKVAGV